ncbi:MAG: hypothetical protein AAF566_09315 [Pseudomonadota bacterium]
MLEKPRAELVARPNHDRRMNVIQLIALCVAIGLSAGAAARLSGMGWLSSGLISWAATVVGVFGCTALIFVLEILFERDPAQDDDTDQVDTDEGARAWEEDCRDDRGFGRDGSTGDVEAITPPDRVEARPRS